MPFWNSAELPMSARNNCAAQEMPLRRFMRAATQDGSRCSRCGFSGLGRLNPFELYLRSVGQVFDFISDKTGKAEPLADWNLFDIGEIVGTSERRGNDEMVALVCGKPTKSVLSLIAQKFHIPVKREFRVFHDLFQVVFCIAKKNIFQAFGDYPVK